MRLLALTLVFLGACASAPAQIEADPLAPQFEAFVEQVRAEGDLPPGFGVIITRGEDVIYEYAYGVHDQSTNVPMTLDTPIISASITKSYIALLAARLDAKGVISLDATIADIWPDINLPAPLDPRAITVRRLLSHSSGMNDSWLEARSINAGDVTLADVAPHLARYSTTTEPGFQYSNFGTFLYSMMVEHVTGRDWRAVLEDEVFRPMGLTRTSIRLTDLPEHEIAHCHARQAGQWDTLPVEPAAALTAAGGIYMSVRDASRFVQAFATSGATSPNIPSAQIERTLQQEVTQEGDLFGFARDGYGLGWDLSGYEGQRIISRSGAYPGCRSLIAYSSSTGVSVAAFGVGDAGTNIFLFALARHAFDIAAGNPRPDERLAQYREEHAAAIARSDAVVHPDLTRPLADPAPMLAYAGAYESDMAGRFDIAATPQGLDFGWGVFHMPLIPTEGDAFNGYIRGFADPQPISFERDAQGRVSAIKWEDVTAQRVQVR